MFLITIDAQTDLIKINGIEYRKNCLCTDKNLTVSYPKIGIKNLKEPNLLGNNSKVVDNALACDKCGICWEQWL